MSDILQIFSGNPLSTFIGKKIEAATRSELEADDWALNLEICDLINESDDDAKDAVRAIRKRLQQIEQDRNFTITNRTLTVLETCVSNCSRRFHVLVMTKDFIQDLVKLIGPKNNPPIELQERVLSLIERWAEVFRSQPELGGVVSVYNDLTLKGVTFPTRDPNSSVPIQTPRRRVPPNQSASPPLTGRMSTMPRQQVAQGHPGVADQPPVPVVLEGEGYNKISQDLGVVQNSVEMFNEIMQVLEGSDAESDWVLATDLQCTCRMMKDRIVDLIERVANEDLTIELLRLNDTLNNTFIKYDRLVKNKAKTTPDQASVGTAQAGDASSSTSTSASRLATSRADAEPSLIDLDAGDSVDDRASTVKSATMGSQVPSTLAPTSTTAPVPKASQVIADPFDSSLVDEALTRQQTSKKSNILSDLPVSAMRQLSLGDQQTSNTSKRASNLPEEISSVREQDFAEIENWLKTDSGRELSSLAGDMSSLEPISIPNSEFDNFIASRALAGSSTAQTGTQGSNSSSQSTLPKQLEPST